MGGNVSRGNCFESGNWPGVGEMQRNACTGRQLYLAELRTRMGTHWKPSSSFWRLYSKIDSRGRYSLGVNRKTSTSSPPCFNFLHRSSMYSFANCILSLNSQRALRSSRNSSQLNSTQLNSTQDSRKNLSEQSSTCSFPCWRNGNKAPNIPGGCQTQVWKSVRKPILSPFNWS